MKIAFNLIIYVKVYKYKTDILFSSKSSKLYRDIRGQVECL